MNKVILSCLLLLVAGCAGTIQKSQSSYLFKNITLTCVYNTLEEMEGITKVWVYYDGLPRFPTFSRSHLSPEDGIGFEGKGFSGTVRIRSSVPPREKISVIVDVYSENRYYGFGELPQIIQQTQKQIKESLFDSCNE
jgi:hypothetical protein